MERIRHEGWYPVLTWAGERESVAGETLQWYWITVIIFGFLNEISMGLGTRRALPSRGFCDGSIFIIKCIGEKARFQVLLRTLR